MMRWALAAVVCLAPTPAFAAAPLKGLLGSLINKNALSGEDLALTEKHGPWMIMAASFHGEGAEESAEELALELRRRYHLKAFVHQQETKLDQDLPVGLDQYGNPKQFKYASAGDGVIAGAVVLVGHFEAVDSSAAQRQLEKVKYEVHPDCLNGPSETRDRLSFFGMRNSLRKVLPENHEIQAKGPLGHAFITTNPLLPNEYFAPQGVDKFVERMNRDVEHSLLDLESRFTVRVATFRGLSAIGDRALEEAASDDGSNSQLAKAAEKAHELVEALRARGWEAYEFHDRDESIVAIGGFDDAKEVALGRYAPTTSDALRTVQTFSATRSQYNADAAAMLSRFGAGSPGLSIQPKTLIGIYGARPGVRVRSGDKIPFDVRPEVILAPKRSIAADYRRNGR